MKILVCGSRHYSNYKKITEVLSNYIYHIPVTIIHGGCKGADTICGTVAKEFGFDVKEYPADWNAHGRAAGPLRNKLMLYDNPDIEHAIVFHENIEQSKGSADMLKRVKAAGISYTLIE